MAPSVKLLMLLLGYLLFNIGNNYEIQIHNENGQPVNLMKLVQQYSLICPLTSFCMERTREMVGFNETKSKNLGSFSSDCVTCTCTKGCLETKTCCPDAPFAYEKHECLDVTIWSIDNKTHGPDYLIKKSCSNNEDTALRELCESDAADLQPLYSPKTTITYKNEFCARCNGIDTETMMPWPIKMVCLGETTSDIQMVLRNCIFIYTPIGFRSGRNCHQPSQDQITMFNSCNITGLWKEFDPDIDFACKNFNQPYGKFRNVYCYICNPDKTSLEVKTDEKIDTCPSTTNSKIITNLCDSRNVTGRLHPYKNIYCQMCNLRYVFENKTGPIKIRQISDPPSAKSTILEITIKANDHTAKTAKDIANLLAHQPGIKFNIQKDPPSGPRIENISSLVQQYALVCGFVSVCNRSYLKDLPQDNLPFYRPCPRCDCHDDCVTGPFPCCIDKVLNEKLYQCVDQSNFLSMSFQEKVQEERYHESLPEKTYALVSECPESADLYFRSKCLSTVSTDILENIPIVSSSSVAFKNIYCAECYQKSSQKENKIYLKFSCDSFFENILYNSLEKMFEKAAKLRCHIASTLPDENLCYDPNVDRINGMITKCNVTGSWKGKDNNMRKACEETDQTGIMNLNLYQYQLMEYYKNPFCALCNQELSYVREASEIMTKCTIPAYIKHFKERDSVTELCEKMPVYDWWGRYKNVYCFSCHYTISGYDNVTIYDKTSFVWYSYVSSDNPVRSFSYRTLFSISKKELNEAISEVDIQCENGAFDHEKDECVDFSCIGTRILQDGRCVHAFDSLEKVKIMFNVMLKLPERKAENEDNSTVTIHPLDVCLTIIDNVRWRLSHVQIVNVEFLQCQIRATSCLATKTENTSHSSEWKISQKAFLEVELRMYAKYTNNLTLLEDTIIDTYDEKFVINDKFFIQHYYNIGHLVVFNCAEDFKFSFKILYGYRRLYRRNKCPLVKFFKTAEVYFDEGSDTLFMNKENTKIPGNDVERVSRDGQHYFLICNDSLPSGIGHRRKPPASLKNLLFDRIYIVFSSCCTGLSLLGLFFTFMTYCLFSDLRTVPGKNNMHLSLCLFLAQSGLQYSLNLTNHYNSIQCKVTGVIIHYFWLASFCAMNTCSYHMFTVFCTKEINFQSTSHQKFRLACKYACYIYLSPFISVAIVIITQLFRSNLTSIGYGETFCFIGGFYVRILSFIIPSGLITLMNFLFYILTFYRLKTSPRVSSSGKDRQNLIIYAKLCSITGILWPVMFVDAVFEISVFSFLATFLTAMQGVFIFFSFVCNRRVLRMYRKLGVNDSEVSGQSAPRTLPTTNNQRDIRSSPAQ